MIMSPNQLTPASFPDTPSAQTLFRMRIADAESYALVQQGIARLKPLLWLRDARNVRRIEAAGSPQELLDLVPLATGLGEPAWHTGMRQYGLEVLPLIGEILDQISRVQEVQTRRRVSAQLIAELRWRGREGAGLLLDRFAGLDAYGRGLAAVVLGLLGESSAGDLIWSFYQDAVLDPEEMNFVGALWGLLDLDDPRGAPALQGLLQARRFFFELFGFLARAGRAPAVVPLLDLMPGLEGNERMDALVALVAIAHRIGEKALADAIEAAARGQDTRQEYEALAGLVLSKPPGLPQEYFASFYRGFTPGDVARVLENL